MIALDIDGVITDTVDLARRYLWRDFHYDIQGKIKEFTLHSAVPFMTEEEIYFYLMALIKNNVEDLKSCDPTVFSTLSFINSMITNPVVFITARPDFLITATEDWFQLNCNYIKRKIIHCRSKDKINHIKEHKIKYFVEDRLKNANNLAEHEAINNIFLVNRDWNIGRETHPKVIRIDRLSKVLDYLKF
jgi:uncharacterized HAD superfamily protein